MTNLNKSLWLDKPDRRPNVVRQSQTVTGRMIGAHPTEKGYALVDMGGENPVNVRMSEGSIGWEGAPVVVMTTPEGAPMLGSISTGKPAPAEAQKVSFGPTGKAVLAGEAAQKRTDQTLVALHTELGEAQKTLSAAGDKIRQASTAATQAQNVAAQATKAATEAMGEAKTAPRIAVGTSRQSAQKRLTTPYRDGDTVIVGSGSPLHVDQTWTYQAGGWKRHLLTVENLVVNQALWASLVQADEGEIKNLVVGDQALVKELIVTGKATLREMIAELIKGKRIEGVEIRGGDYASSSGRVRVNDEEISVESDSGTPGKISLDPGDLHRTGPEPELKFLARNKELIIKARNPENITNDPQPAGMMLCVSVKPEGAEEETPIMQLGDTGQGYPVGKYGERIRFNPKYVLYANFNGTLVGETRGEHHGPSVGEHTGRSVGEHHGSVFGAKTLHVPSHTGRIAPDSHASVDLSSVSPDPWETEVLYRLPGGNLPGNTASSYDVENIPAPPEGHAWMWEAITQQGIGIMVDWVNVPAGGEGKGTIHINNGGSWAHTLDSTILRRTLIKEG